MTGNVQFRRRRFLRPQLREELIEDGLRRPLAAVGDPDPAGQRGVHGIARGLAHQAGLVPQLREASQQQHQVDRAAHGRSHPHVPVLAGGPGQGDREVHLFALPPGLGRGDPALGGRVLVAEHDPADPVRDRVADPRRADRVERVHGRDEPETRIGLHQTQPRHRDLTLGEDRDQDVERLLGYPVELLQVQQRTRAHRLQQRSVGETRRDVALGQHLRRVVLPDEPGRRQLGVAFHEHHPGAEITRDVPEQRGLAGAGRPFQDHVPPGVQRDCQYLTLSPQAHDLRYHRSARPARFSQRHAG